MKDVLTKCERAVYDYIALLEEKYQIANPSVKQVCDATTYSERAVQNALKHMQDIGIIGVDHKTDRRIKGESAPQRWTRPMTLHDKQHVLHKQQLSFTAPSNILTTTHVVDKSSWGDPVDHYWKRMEYIDQNTDRLKRKPVDNPKPVQQRPIDFDAWPW